MYSGIHSRFIQDRFSLINSMFSIACLSLTPPLASYSYAIIVAIDKCIYVVSISIFGCSIQEMGGTKVYSRSVDPRKLRIGVKYYVVHSCIHQNHILRLLVCTRTVRARIANKNACGYVCFAAIYFAISFMVVKPIQSKQVEVSLASYLCLHHTRLYYFSTYCTQENSIMAFMATL